MNTSRRKFLGGTSLTLMSAMTGAYGMNDAKNSQSSKLPPGAPPAFATAPPAGPEVTAETFAEAEKLERVTMTQAHREEAAGSWAQAMAPLYERRTGPRKVELPETLFPASRWNPVIPGAETGPETDLFVTAQRDAGPLPAKDEDIAFAAVWQLAHWLRTRQLTSARLTEIYLERLQKYDGELRCVITLTPELARSQAKQADAEIAAGHYRGPLHGIPWGAKDLLDTAEIRTTWGAKPFEHRVPKKNAVVVERLERAGAVLVAKLSLGALALNDVWFGGQTMNPWLPEEGSSGSSAGPGAAVAAGLVAFAIGSETEGSIVSPSMRCGVTGLRPTFGRVARTGAMTLCWSLDKLGPMARTVEDTMLVLHTISGPDAGDIDSLPSHLHYDARVPAKGIRVGYIPAWMQEAPATEVDRKVLAMLPELGMTPVEMLLPDWPYGSLNTILFAEAAASFEKITLDGQVDEMRMQTPDSWPNLFRQARFLSAVDYVQTDRLRRLVAEQMVGIFSDVDVLLVPSLRDEILTLTNFTGHPSLTLRAGFVEVSEARSDWAPDPKHPLPHFNPPRRVPHGVTFIGKLFDEGTVARAGLAVEHKLNVWQERPAGF
jgi:Asp-tRNA(Asn)/Glu-tRNA(Gln) amidotransferase A subunit family amidase